MSENATPPPARARTRWTKRHYALGCGSLVALFALVLVVIGLVLDVPRPRGSPDPAAEALTDAMWRALRADAWERTGAIRWTFGPTGARHLWDRERNWARVRWGEDLEAQIDLDVPSRGVVFRGGARLAGDEARRAIRQGWEQWVNDSFWLVAPFKVRDRGTNRSVVRVEGRDALLVEYASGGATPGDAYLWLLDDDGTPRAWRMWVQVLPVGGLEASWERWITLPTGARVATRHALGPMALELRDIEAAEHLAMLEPGDDPFAALAALAP